MGPSGGWGHLQTWGLKRSFCTLSTRVQQAHTKNKSCSAEQIKRSSHFTKFPCSSSPCCASGDRAAGVEYVHDGRLKRVEAAREVILSAGTVGSPHLLMLSGVGPKRHLEDLNVRREKKLFCWMHFDVLVTCLEPCVVHSTNIHCVLRQENP